MQVASTRVPYLFYHTSVTTSWQRWCQSISYTCTQEVPSVTLGTLLGAIVLLLIGVALSYYLGYLLAWAWAGHSIE
jgi:small-conductance mechanosensitive channel